MNPRTDPHRTERAERARLERLAREADALRANLRRRKAQDRARAAGDMPDAAPPRAGTAPDG